MVRLSFAVVSAAAAFISGRRHLNSRRAAAQKPNLGLTAVAEMAPERQSKVKGPEDTSAELAATGLGSTGPPGGCFNLIDCSGDVPYTTRSVRWVAGCWGLFRFSLGGQCDDA